MQKVLLLSLRVAKIFKIIEYLARLQAIAWLSQCLMHFARLANTHLNDEGSARDNYVLACNFAKYLPI